VGMFHRLPLSYNEASALASRRRGAGFRGVSPPACVIHHDISATNDHRSPALQRRIARNAELVFWWNLPRHSLLLAAVPHLAFVALQAGWRLLRGRPGPLFAGKLDAALLWRAIRERRRVRSELAHSALNRPHFAFSSGSLGDVRNHLRRPPETTRPTSGVRYRG